MKKFLLLLLLSHFSLAQSILGSWENLQYGYSFVFRQNGTYSFDFPTQNMQNLSGTFVQNGNILELKNAYGAVNYAVQWAGSQLRLSDAQGTWILSKKGQNKVLDPTKYPKIIAQKNAYSLTEAGPRVYESILNFVLDKKISSSDFIAIQTETKRLFTSNPQLIISDIQMARESFEQILQSGDPNVIGQFRQAFLGQVYHLAVVDQNPDMQVFWKIMDKHLDVLAYDPKSQLVLTSNDLESYLNYVDLLNVQQSGSKLSTVQRNLLREQTTANFSKLRLNEKKFLANAGLAYDLTKSNLERFTAQQTQTFRQQYTPHVQPVQTQQMDTDFYQRYSRMMLESHVSMLNGIENLGGTGDYWEIKPSYGW